MFQPIEIWVAGPPKGQPRPKAFSRGNHAGVYDPGTANEWKARIHEASKGFIPAVPMEMPLRVDLVFYFSRPDNHCGTGRNAGILKANAPVFFTSKPDRDNLDKAVLDQLTVSRMWLDDKQVVDGRIVKRYDDGRGPGVAIRISEAQS